MKEEMLDQISKKLDVLISIGLKQLTGEKDLESRSRKQGVGEQARFLSEFGLNSKDISAITGAPITSVRTLLTPSRKK